MQQLPPSHSPCTPSMDPGWSPAVWGAQFNYKGALDARPAQIR